jgi:uncharacterized membrane protein YhaH (DUF805 family)
MDWPHILASPVVGFVVWAIFTFLLVFWPVLKILRRIGRSGWWSLLAFAWPLGLYLLAYTRWPAIDPPKG